MTQDERWTLKYNEAMELMAATEKTKSSARLRMRSTFGRFACERTTTFTSH